MSKQERLELFVVIKSSRIKMKDIASSCNLSPALISRFFNNSCNMSIENIEAVKNYIMNYEKGS